MVEAYPRQTRRAGAFVGVGVLPWFFAVHMRLAAACLLFLIVMAALGSALLFDWQLHQYGCLQTCAAPLEQQR